MKLSLKLRACAALLTLSITSPVSAELYCPQSANASWWSDLDMIDLYDCLQNGKARGRDIDGMDEEGLTLLSYALEHGANATQIEAILDRTVTPLKISGSR